MTDISAVTAIALPAQGSRLRSMSPEEIKAWREKQMADAIEEDRKAREARLAESLRSKLGRRFASRNFDNYRAEGSNKTAAKACKTFAEKVDYGDGAGLLIVGNYGVGKTHMAAAITNRLLDRGIPCLFDTFAGHMAKLKAEFNSNEPRRYLDFMKAVPVLVIDDAGKENVTDYAREVMFDVVNSRYESYRPIVITTNYTPDGLKKYLGDAVYSRLCEICPVVAMTGADYRQR